MIFRQITIKMIISIMQFKIKIRKKTYEIHWVIFLVLTFKFDNNMSIDSDIIHNRVKWIIHNS